MEPEVLGLALIRDIKSQGGESDPPSAGLNFGVEYENAGTASDLKFLMSMGQMWQMDRTIGLTVWLERRLIEIVALVQKTRRLLTPTEIYRRGIDGQFISMAEAGNLPNLWSKGLGKLLVVPF